MAFDLSATTETAAMQFAGQAASIGKYESDNITKNAARYNLAKNGRGGME